jgi:FtsP/CotA-like multicopper oxidase with cupredoxin domain
MDGVPSITQCPTAPADSITYTWRATQYGSSWYHSHFSLQAWDGVFGGIVIRGPATANYDTDLGNLFLNDWSHKTSDVMYLSAEENGPPTLDNGLINGTNVYDDAGSRFTTTFESGTKYLLRIVNGAIDSHFKFMIDSHNLTVIAMDFVPIVPFTTEVLNIGMGQRYDVIVEANQATDDYWLRAIPQTTCSDNDSTNNIKGIIRYNSSSTSDPSSSAYTFTDTCDDEDTSNLVPYLSLNVSSSTVEDDESVTVGENSDSLFRWYMNKETFQVEWDDPTLMKVYENNDTFTSQEHVIEIDTADEWQYVAISTSNTVPHPIHLHGHDFYILAQGSGTYDSSTMSLTLTNPPRRDVAMLPGGGHLVLAFKADNPGAWLMHCHIGWHTSEGFALQFVERWDEITALIDYDTLNSTCTAWDTYTTADDVVEDESGV